MLKYGFRSRYNENIFIKMLKLRRVLGEIRICRRGGDCSLIEGCKNFGI